eukprot:151602_1
MNTQQVNIASRVELMHSIGELKEEEKNIFLEDYKQKNTITKFIQPQISDYTDCIDDITKCNAVCRIIHLLEHYEHNRSISQYNDGNVVLLYEYIAELPKYTISMFMEDWHHAKTKHLKSQTDYKLFKSNQNINCDNEKYNGCVYINRHRRPRGKDVYDIDKEMDYKNIILSEQIDSIHAFIFHSQSPRYHMHEHKNMDDDENIVLEMNMETKTQKHVTDIWSNKPQSIRECNINQILYIFNSGHVFDNLDILLEYKDDIISYIKQHELNGEKLSEMKRKQFYVQLSDHLNNKKLRQKLGTLYSRIMQIDVQTIYMTSDKNIQWSNQPTSTRDCTLEQIIYILNNGNIFNASNKLNTYKNDIINYFQQNNLHGMKLSEMQRKPFMTELSEHFGDKKLRAPFAKLYSEIIKFDTKQFWQKDIIDDINDTQQQQLKDVISNNKFTTSMTEYDEKRSLYSFGELYRYTDHFKEMDHPLFVPARYSSFKEEIVEYFKRQNANYDKMILMNSQLEMIESMQPHLQPLFKKLICKQYITNNDLEHLWCDVDQKHDCGVIEWVKSDFQRLCGIINKITLYSTNHMYISNDFIFVGLLESTLKLINNNITDNLGKFITRMRQKVNEPDKQTGDASGYKMLIEILKLQKANKDRETKEVSIELERANKEKNRDFPTRFNDFFGDDQNQIFVVGLSKYFKITFQEIVTKAATDLINGYIKHIEPNYNTGFNKQFIILRFYLDEYRPSKKMLYYIERFLNLLVSDIFNKSKLHTTPKGLDIDVVCETMKVTKTRFYNEYVAIKCRKYVNLLRIAKAWSENSFNTEHPSGDNLDRQRELMEIFEMNQEELNTYIDDSSNDIKMYYKQFSIARLQEAIMWNETIYIELQNNKRCQYYIEKATLKHEQNSVKRIKAVWYHGMNEYHNINPGAPLGQQHITALICYTSNSVLCTSFRETYRRKYDNETIKKQKIRHGVFANMGRLLYEAFIFYASKESEITVLYHGMSRPLLFSSLYCAFNAPTSTTTEQSIGLEFGHGTGILIKFESSESSKYIRTLNMSLFSCFDRESEHLIFETRLHIKDIFVPTERQWMGNAYMKPLSLYDLLDHGNNVHRKYLL